MIAITLGIAGTIAIILAVHSIITMSRKSVWPTIVLFTLGAALIFEGVTLGIVKLFVGG